MASSTETNKETKQMEQQHSEPLICKSTVLKVSIHCEGCKRKVKKILQGVHGVYDINIDLRQQKVVVTGNVTSDILIRKLTKAGKHVELWPQQLPPDSKKQQQNPADKRRNDTEISCEEETNQNDNEIIQSGVINDNETGKVKAKAVEISKTDVQISTGSNSTAKNSDGSIGGGAVNKLPSEVSCATGKTGVEEPKAAEVRQTVVLPAGPVSEKKVNVAVQFPNENELAAAANEKIGGATSSTSNNNGGKKKKKKGKVNNNNERVTATTATVNVEHLGDAPINRSQGQSGLFHGGTVVHPGPVRTANESPPGHDHIQYHPPSYYAPPPTAAAPPSVCTVSHHTAYPSSSSSSYGAAYYYAPPPPQPYSYAHLVQPGTEMEPRPYTYESESYTLSQPSDSFEFFSDENPNACSVM